MKKFLTTRYHLILLGLAVLAAGGSAAFLSVHSMGFKETFKPSQAPVKATPYTASANANATVASEHLKNGVLWNQRADGASPFVSRPYILKEGKLLDPMEGDTPLYPPVPNKWLVDHHLDYSDMNILSKDPKHKGFTVLEEFQAGTDPNNASEFPPLSSKLILEESGIKKSSYLLEFIGEEPNEKGEKEIQIKPAQPLANPAKGNRPDTAIRGVMKGETIPGAPFLKVVDLIEKKKTINDTEYDVSELVLENTQTGEHITLVKKNTSREYTKTPIEIVESISFGYQLNGGAREDFNVERGKELSLSSLDKTHTETYRLVDISKEGVLLDRDGKKYTVKISSPAAQ
jgi:hypothetical protein